MDADDEGHVLQRNSLQLALLACSCLCAEEGDGGLQASGLRSATVWRRLWWRARATTAAST